jgi:hypothetical protein
MMEDHDMPEIETDELPQRRRRSGVTPAMAILAAVFLAALGFIGGAQVQKARGDDASTAAPTAFRQAGGAAGAAGGQEQAASFTAGTVKSKRGGTLYVETQDGTTVRVTTAGETEVVRTAKGTVDSVHPGDTVVVQGAQKDGAVKASRVTATASGVSTGGFGGGGARPGSSQGGPPQQDAGG